MARIPLTCPIDGTALGPATTNIATERTGSTGARDTGVGEHVHARVSSQQTCTNGHVWLVSGELRLDRVS